MGFFEYLGLFVFLYYIIYAVLIVIFDCDLRLAFAERFGVPIDALKGKVIWITGASSGIGKHLAYHCAKHGSKVVLSARRENELQEVKKKCIEQGAKKEDILVLPMDMLEISSHQTKMDTVLKEFGKLDILVNNAGRSQRASWEETDIEVDRQLFELNVFSVVALSRVAVRYFKTVSKGHIAITSSTAGLIPVPFSGSYTGSKHALHGYFGSLQTEIPEFNIDITLFCPGPTFTDFLQESFTENPGEKFGKSVQRDDKRMTGERCGELFAIALANKLDTTWASIFPISPLTYLTLYFPNIRYLIFKMLGTRGLMKLRDSKNKTK
ncbi:dehydrogenase/reductase SDR family member 7-like [Ctenocephalides felis]|uniref:dehydrogenase/reductase SDR family member 7-like n=1 Tax=Ctenocephalides felis TaxID=7515 RepID=UPI000E6E28A1|nr:dehydrogenase/reductase SDR family member 7-like [Ctenocephalides felis]